MELTNDQKVEIFCAALSAIIEAQASFAVAGHETGTVVFKQDAVAEAAEMTSRAALAFKNKF